MWVDVACAMIGSHDDGFCCCDAARPAPHDPPRPATARVRDQLSGLLANSLSRFPIRDR